MAYVDLGPAASHMGYEGHLACGFSCTDRKKSIAWYQEVLGFTLVFDSEEHNWCEFETGVEGVTVGLSVVESINKGGGATLTFSVHDVERARKNLEERGVKLDGPTRDYGTVKIAGFYDPDENVIMLFQDVPKPG